MGPVTNHEGSKVIWRVGDLIAKYQDELAELESIDNGRSVVVAKAADVPLAADIFQYMAAVSCNRGLSGIVFILENEDAE